MKMMFFNLLPVSSFASSPSPHLYADVVFLAVSYRHSVWIFLCGTWPTRGPLQACGEPNIECTRVLLEILIEPRNSPSLTETTNATQIQQSRSNTLNLANTLASKFDGGLPCPITIPVIPENSHVCNLHRSSDPASDPEVKFYIQGQSMAAASCLGFDIYFGRGITIYPGNISPERDARQQRTTGQVLHLG